MRPKEVLSGSIDTKIDEEALQKGKEFLARIEEHLQGLAKEVEGQPITDGGNVRFRPRENESLYFINGSIITRETMGVDIDGDIHNLGLSEHIVNRVVIPVDHIDVPISERMLPVMKAEVTSVPSRDNDMSAYGRCVATFDVYSVMDIREHDFALIQEN